MIDVGIVEDTPAIIERAKHDCLHPPQAVVCLNFMDTAHRNSLNIKHGNVVGLHCDCFDPMLSDS
jgi:hypothetical protein